MEARFERQVETSDRVNLVWLDYGPETGRTVALVHGLAAGADQFDTDARFFAEHGYRVLVPDLRGHGRSGKPDPRLATNYSVERMARDLVELFDAAGAERVDYVGNSLGGILALALLPARASRFRTLATFGTATGLDLPGFTPALLPLSYRLLGRRLAGRVAAFATTPSPEGRPVIEQLVAGFDPEVGRAIAASVSRYDFFVNAERFAGPYLMLRGEKDYPVNLALRSALPRLARLPGFTRIDLKNAGHCANLDRPETFRQILLDFWSRH